MLPAAALIAVAIEPECNLNSLAVISTFKIHAKVLKREREFCDVSGRRFCCSLHVKGKLRICSLRRFEIQMHSKVNREGRVPFHAVMANGFQFMQLHEAVVVEGRPCVGVLQGVGRKGREHCGPHATVFASR